MYIYYTFKLVVRVLVVNSYKVDVNSNILVISHSSTVIGGNNHILTITVLLRSLYATFRSRRFLFLQYLG